MGLLELVMMGSGIAAIYYVVFWSIRNDKVRAIDEQTGLLRMRVPDGEGRAPLAGGQSRRRGVDRDGAGARPRGAAPRRRRHER